MRLLAIDPGPTQSAYVVVDQDLRPRVFNKVANPMLLHHLNTSFGHVVIEQIGHYGTGMPAGKDVFDTCVWIGRFIQACPDQNVALVKRATVKTHLCGTPKATDANVIQALIDRFAPGERNHGKGVKNAPGFFYGFHSDIWQAMALAVYQHDILTGRTPDP
jgi:hypothetical protein